MVNFFAVDHKDKRLILADLPGYGFSAIGKEVRHHWQALVDGYLARPEIRELLFLFDSRRVGDLKDDDLGLLEMLGKRKAPVTVVLTKCDKLNQSETQQAIKLMSDDLKKQKLKVERIVAVSSLKKKGIEQLRELVITPYLG